MALAIVAPFWSLTVAEIWDVEPSEARLRLVTERVIDVATGVGVGVGAVGLLSPPQLCDRINKPERKKGVSSRNDRLSPLPPK